MTDLVFEQSSQLRRDGIPFALATVIAVRGSASARPGSKAVISQDGKNLAGWVGGGCAESFVCKQACESLSEEKPRIVTADLDDEIFGLGMPCGGVMDVYIEPILPPKYLSMEGPKNQDQEELTALVRWHAEHLGFSLNLNSSTAMASEFSETRFDSIPWTTPENQILSEAFQRMNLTERSLVGIASSLANVRGQSFLPMNAVDASEVKQLNVSLRHAVEKPELWIIGRGRITEEMARLGAQLNWPVTIVSSLAEASAYPSNTIIKNETLALREPVPKDALLVVASHHKGDPEWIEKSFHDNVAYVGLIASHHRVGLIKEEMVRRGCSENTIAQLSAPGGLQMDCRSPQEIALSLVVEMIVRLHADHKTGSVSEFGIAAVSGV